MKKPNRNEDEESTPSWKKKSESDESSSDDGFNKPVDFGIDRETSEKIADFDKLVLDTNNRSNEFLDSAPTSSRDQLLVDNPSINYIKRSLNLRDQGIRLTRFHSAFLNFSVIHFLPLKIYL
jgi:hypothetical protein